MGCPFMSPNVSYSSLIIIESVKSVKCDCWPGMTENRVNRKYDMKNETAMLFIRICIAFNGEKSFLSEGTSIII